MSGYLSSHRCVSCNRWTEENPHQILAGAFCEECWPEYRDWMSARRREQEINQRLARIHTTIQLLYDEQADLERELSGVMQEVTDYLKRNFNRNSNSGSLRPIGSAD